jgi:uncharacterized protein (DUF488 family)
LSAPLFTIGHSNHEQAAFLALLQRHQISVLADVRSSPYSRYTPQFNREQLKTALQTVGVGYVFLGEELGARRSEPDCYVQGKADYNRIAKAPAFLKGLERVKTGAASHRVALMCAEKDPLTCHRTILVCRNLRDAGLDIRHILETGELETHADAEARLLREMKLGHEDLFLSSDERLAEAYAKQGERIAYTEAQAQEPAP